MNPYESLIMRFAQKYSFGRSRQELSGKCLIKNIALDVAEKDLREMCLFTDRPPSLHDRTLRQPFCIDGVSTVRQSDGQSEPPILIMQFSSDDK